MIWNDTIDQGATFYREVSLFSDKSKTIPLNLAGKTPRAALMANGRKIADMPCAVKDSDNGVVAWTVPRAVTATLIAGKIYDYFIYVDNTDGTTDPAMRGQVSVSPGLVAA